MHRSFVSYVVVIVESRDDKGNGSVPRVDVTIDCGPQSIRIASAAARRRCIMGLGVALKNEISFNEVKAQQGNFDEYDMIRINEAPSETRHDFDVTLGGVGKPRVPPIARALINAIFAATGKRTRKVGSRLPRVSCFDNAIQKSASVARAAPIPNGSAEFEWHREAADGTQDSLLTSTWS